MLGGVAMVAMGWGIMKGEVSYLERGRLKLILCFNSTATTPTDEELYNKLSPSLKKQVDLQRQAGDRQLAYAEQLRVRFFSDQRDEVLICAHHGVISRLLQKAREQEEAPLLSGK